MPPMITQIQPSSRHNHPFCGGYSRAPGDSTRGVVFMVLLCPPISIHIRPSSRHHHPFCGGCSRAPGDPTRGWFLRCFYVRPSASIFGLLHGTTTPSVEGILVPLVMLMLPGPQHPDSALLLAAPPPPAPLLSWRFKHFDTLTFFPSLFSLLLLLLLLLLLQHTCASLRMFHCYPWAPLGV